MLREKGCPAAWPKSFDPYPWNMATNDEFLVPYNKPFLCKYLKNIWYNFSSRDIMNKFYRVSTITEQLLITFGYHECDGIDTHGISIDHTLKGICILITIQIHLNM